MSAILALDLGTCTGYAIGDAVDTEEWATPKEVTAWKRNRLTRRGDPRITRFYEWLKTSIACYGVDRIVFEDVEFCSQTYQCQLWTSFRTCIWIAVYQFPRIIVDAVPVRTLKKFATGDGGASKLGMARALASRQPARFSIKGSKGLVMDKWRRQTIDDNAVDAKWLQIWAEENAR